MFLIFVAVSVVFAVVCVLNFFFPDCLGLYTKQDLLYTRSFPFLPRSAIYHLLSARVVDSIPGSAKGFSWFSRHVSQYTIIPYVYIKYHFVRYMASRLRMELDKITLFHHHLHSIVAL